jgi:hypothetical protein
MLSRIFMVAYVESLLWQIFTQGLLPSAPIVKRKVQIPSIYDGRRRHLMTNLYIQLRETKDITTEQAAQAFAQFGETQPLVKVDTNGKRHDERIVRLQADATQPDHQVSAALLGYPVVRRIATELNDLTTPEPTPSSPTTNDTRSLFGYVARLRELHRFNA